MGIIENFPYGRTPPILRSSGESLASSNFGSSIPTTPPSEPEDNVPPARECHRGLNHPRRRDPALLLQRLEQITRKRVGAQKARRENNALILQTLAEGDDEENNYQCPTIEDFIPNVQSPFSRLMKDSESMRVWQYFLSQSEEAQAKYLADIVQKRKSKSNFSDLGIYFTQILMDDRDKDEKEEKFNPAPNSPPSQRFSGVSKNLRNILKKPNLPLGVLSSLEGDVIGIFQKDSNAIYVSPLLTNFERLLLHGISQYYFLHSKSKNMGGGRRTKVQNNFTSFSVPKMSLKEYLEKKNSTSS